MAFFLAKTDPETYSIDDFARDKQTVWDGVKNPQAVQAIAQMKKGDWVFLYHSQGESAIVGLAKVTSASRPDPNTPKSWVVDMQYVGRLEPPTSLKEIKDSKLFADFNLVRNSRLSTMACPDNFVEWVRQRYPKAKF